MVDYRLGEMEARFADLIWENEPVSSGALVTLAAQQLNWKKSTTYTVLRRLTEKGLFTNENGMVSRVLTKAQWETKQSEHFVNETFGGSLPKFLVAFTSRKKLTEEEIEALKKMIEDAGK